MTEDPEQSAQVSNPIDEWDNLWGEEDAESQVLASTNGAGSDWESLDETIQEFETIQADLNYRQAQNSLQQLIQKLDLTPRERSGLEAEIADLQGMLTKLDNQVVQIAVFGMVSRGKSSVLNALLGHQPGQKDQPIFATGPLHGVTRQSQRAIWQPEATPNPETGMLRAALPGLGNSRLELIDTPGIDEVDGDARERLAQQVARHADLILFVVAGDITKIEFAALAELRQAGKPILLVFNKIDQYPLADRQAIYEKIRDERVKELLSADEIVMAAAAPLVAKAIQRPDGTIGAELVSGAPKIDDLKLKILEILHREGKALVALNTMLYANEVNEQLVQRKMQIRDHSANQIIWKAVMAKALATALNPVTVVDIFSSVVIDVSLIVSLSRLYGINMTHQGAVKLLKKIALAMGGVGVSELLANLGLSSLKGLLSLTAPATAGGSLLSYAPVAIAQAGVAGFSTYGVGQVVKQYLANGAAWGPQGPKTVVHQILNSLDQTYILNRIKAELRAKLQGEEIRNLKVQ
jgi:GTPase